ncbi:MAG: hypothetical protein LBO77_08130, partial [Desulfovibrio sp.]|nr:hypothetical protein [Desulfovibrio sp.]
YRAAVPEDPPAAFAQAWSAVDASRSIPWRRETKKGIRELDARPFFLRIRRESEHSRLLDLDWSPGYVSPLALCRHVLSFGGYGGDMAPLSLTKLFNLPDTDLPQ